ncbi:hypothetical protein CX682_23705 [Pseudomonas sp. FFUP_PS_41]|nr:hypothetical protein CX682_23705 [Pseudomonas sp. FFUP_PS_41]
MSCSGCAARREWINKWTKVAYERAKSLFDVGTRRDQGDARADGHDPEGRAGVPVDLQADPGRTSQDQ